MIIFEKCRWKNFLSTGDKFIELDLRKHASTLIVGHNGAGKSTLLDAISFALFGKAHRNINKPLLVNSINNKHCVVEVEFSIGKHSFKVVRGIKPARFEIWQNGQMANQDANSRDHQKFLEQNILKLNHKSFHQIVVLGSSSFVPFMQLPSNHRREVIEDLLDINIFSKMNTLLKEQVSNVKEQSKDITYNIDLLKDKIELQRKHIREITEIKSDQITKQKQRIKELAAEAYDISVANKSLTEQIQKFNLKELQESKKDVLSKIKTNTYQKGTIENKVQTLVEAAKFFETNDHCPTCDQDISEGVKSKKKSYYQVEAQELMSEMKTLESTKVEVEQSLLELEKVISDITDKQMEMLNNNNSISNLQKQIQRIESDMHTEDQVGDVTEANTTLSSLVDDKETLTERKLELLENKTYLEACSEMLKDTGIKTKIIREYLPVMNTLINKYLQVLDFFVQFNLDENFEETILSRHRDNFSYSSFSEGEKARIDLSLLFAWRQIAKMKNSVSTSLLILDETFDSSLDYDGVDNLLKILDTLDDDTNVFIISHKGDVLDGKFQDKIEFTKEGNFSVMIAN